MRVCCVCVVCVCVCVVCVCVCECLVTPVRFHVHMDFASIDLTPRYGLKLCAVLAILMSLVAFTCLVIVACFETSKRILKLLPLDVRIDERRMYRSIVKDLARLFVCTCFLSAGLAELY